MNETITGTIYFASRDAEAKRLYKADHRVNTDLYHRAVFLSDTFVQLDFDSTGTNYVHVTLDAPR